jgi:hypothetical protein
MLCIGSPNGFDVAFNTIGGWPMSEDAYRTRKWVPQVSSAAADETWESNEPHPPEPTADLKVMWTKSKRCKKSKSKVPLIASDSCAGRSCE